MEGLDVPQRAIQAFEKIHGLRVTIHDIRGSLGPLVVGDRFQHSHVLCQCVKSSLGESRCAIFELQRLRRTMHDWPQGRYHVCHAGLVEWVLPVNDGLELDWIIFAGVRSPDESLSLGAAVHREPPVRWTNPPWRGQAPSPAPVGRDEAELILEHLLQLAARLRAWSQQQSSVPIARPLTDPGRYAQFDQGLLVRRNTFIRRYIEAHYTGPVRLKDLAQQLKVSEDRATHAIRECCGQTFRTMLLERRLKAAREMLDFSSLSILEVALYCGFREISYFNRAFKAALGCTPGQYRRGMRGIPHTE